MTLPSPSWFELLGELSIAVIPCTARHLSVGREAEAALLDELAKDASQQRPVSRV